MTGVKEIKDELNVTELLVVFLIERLKDGVDMEDATTLFGKLTMDAEFKRVLNEAYVGISDIGAEVKDLNWMEGMDITMHVLKAVPKFIAAAKK
jgi:hypothetical protein